jgi:hypothetical protein
VLDHFSRLVVGFEVFEHEPSALQMTRILDTAIATTGNAPKYIITDKGAQFKPTTGTGVALRVSNLASVPSGERAPLPSSSVSFFR